MAARVLLAEDNESLALVLQKFLAGYGLEVIRAQNGGDAWALLEAESFDLLLLDLKLPVLNGVELLRKLRESPRLLSLPIIVMSGVYKGERYAEALRRSGIRHYLEKPFTKRDFIDAVQAALPVPVAPAKPAVSSLLELLVKVYNSRTSGLLHLTDGLKVAFLNGEPFSFSSRGREDFPSFLVARGKIGLSDLRLFVESGEERLFLTQVGLLTYDELTEESRLFLVKKLTEALEANLPLKFTAGQPEAESPLVPLSLPHLVYETAKNHPIRFDSAGFVSRSGPLFPARTHRFFRRSNLVVMRKEDIELLELVNGERTFNEIVSHGFPDAAPFLHFLLAFDMIEFRNDPAPEAAPDFPLRNLFNRPLEELKSVTEDTVDFDDLIDEVQDTVRVVVGEERMAAPLSPDEIGFEQAVQRDYSLIKNKNYYELFGLSQSSFSFNALKEAYFKKTREYPADKLMELSGPTLALAQEVLSNYANAYNTLSSVVAKERYDEILFAGIATGLDGKQDEKLQARIQFESGSFFFATGEYENAEKAFQDAYTLEPHNPQHSAFLAWAIYRNPANQKSREVQEKARMLLGKSFKSGKSAEAFSLRGWMLLDEGRYGLAEGEFQKALKLDPREQEARKGLRMIEEKREAEKKGLFRRIFS